MVPGSRVLNCSLGSKLFALFPSPALWSPWDLGPGLHFAKSKGLAAYGRDTQHHEKTWEKEVK